MGEMTAVKIGGIRFTVTRCFDSRDVSHDKSGKDLFGEINYQRASIRFLSASPERELRTIWHEILHGIINEYRIRELIDADGNHHEMAIDQLALGIAEALESAEREGNPYAG